METKRAVSIYPLQYEEIGAIRRVSLHLIPHVDDPERKWKAALSKYKSSRSVDISEQKTIVTNDGGYRLCRASHPLPQGTPTMWQIEFLGSSNDWSHCRLGIATLDAAMEAPVGFDKFGYCVRDQGGVYHCGKKMKECSFPGFDIGDVITFGYDSNDTGTLYVWVNGESCGPVIKNIETNVDWYPAVSCFRGAQLRVIFKRPFVHEPPGIWIPLQDIPPPESKALYTVKDLIDFMDTGDPNLWSEEMALAVRTTLTPRQEMPI